MKRFKPQIWILLLLGIALLMGIEAIVLRRHYSAHDDYDAAAALRHQAALRQQLLRDSMAATDINRNVVVIQPGNTARVIDSLETALQAMELKVSELTEQVQRHTEDSAKRSRQSESAAHQRPQGAKGVAASHLTLYGPSASSTQGIPDVQQAIRQGQRFINQRIRHEAIEAHLDTLTFWDYHAPDLQERLIFVNNAVYEYIDSIHLSYAENDINDIRQQLLLFWQAWHDRTTQKIRDIKLREH